MSIAVPPGTGLGGAGSVTPVPALIASLACSLQAEELLAARRAEHGLHVENLLRHARTTVPMFESAAIGNNDLVAFPVLTRRDYVVAGDRALSRAFDRDEITWRTTSGSTGEPVRVARDLASLYAATAGAFLALWQRYAHRLAVPVPGYPSYVSLYDNPDRSTHDCVCPALAFSVIKQIVIGRGASQDRETARELQDLNVGILGGRPRALLRLMGYQQDLSLQSGPHPNIIVSSGDNLYDNERRQLTDWFGCDLFNAYISQEGGVMAIECPEHEGMHIAEENCIVEVLLPDGSVHPEGAGELVVTNLTNWCMPFIRYRTGDRAVVVKQSCRCGFAGQTIVKLDGRDSVYFETPRGLVNPSVLNPILEALPIRRFQVRQCTARLFEVRWIASSDTADEEVVRTTVERAFRELMGAVDVRVNRVRALGQPHAKVQRFVSELRGVG